MGLCGWDRSPTCKHVWSHTSIYIEGLQDLLWQIFNLRWDYQPNSLPPQSTPEYHYPQAWQFPLGDGLWLMTTFSPCILTWVAHSLWPGHSFLLSTPVPCWLLPRHFQSRETITSLSDQRGIHDPWEWRVSQQVKRTPFSCTGGLQKEAKQQGITLILKFVRKRFHPNLSTSFLILLICGKTKNVNLQW